MAGYNPDMPRLLAALLWLVLCAVPLVGPDIRPDAGAWVIDLITGDWSETEPWVVVHFQLMGVWPLLIGLQLRRFWRGRPLPAAPFCAAAFGVGAYGLLPWFVFRGTSPRPRPMPRLERIVPWLAAVTGLSALALVGFGLVAGSPAAWLLTAQTDGFVWTMAADFLVLWGVSIGTAREADPGRWQWSLVAIFGTVALLALPSRPVQAPPQKAMEG